MQETKRAQGPEQACCASLFPCAALTSLHLLCFPCVASVSRSRRVCRSECVRCGLAAASEAEGGGGRGRGSSKTSRAPLCLLSSPLFPPSFSLSLPLPSPVMSSDSTHTALRRTAAITAQLQPNGVAHFDKISESPTHRQQAAAGLSTPTRRRVARSAIFTLRHSRHCNVLCSDRLAGLQLQLDARRAKKWLQAVSSPSSSCSLSPALPLLLFVLLSASAPPLSHSSRLHHQPIVHTHSSDSR